jgi:hypothetical protein
VSWLDALGWAGSALLIYSLLQARVLRFRVLNLVASLVLTVFNALLGIWPMVAMNAVLAGINVWFIRKLVHDRHDDSAYEVLEVGADDAYLQHVLRVHGEDIRRFFPGVLRRRRRRCAAVGVPGAARHRDGRRPGRAPRRGRCRAGRARLRDAAVPRLHPGRVRVPAQRAVHRPRLPAGAHPPGMVAPYYESLGFRSDGDQWTLDL